MRKSSAPASKSNGMSPDGRAGVNGISSGLGERLVFRKRRQKFKSSPPLIRQVAMIKENPSVEGSEAAAAMVFVLQALKPACRNAASKSSRSSGRSVTIKVFIIELRSLSVEDFADRMSANLYAGADEF